MEYLYNNQGVPLKKIFLNLDCFMFLRINIIIIIALNFVIAIFYCVYLFVCLCIYSFYWPAPNVITNPLSGFSFLLDTLAIGLTHY